MPSSKNTQHKTRNPIDLQRQDKRRLCLTIAGFVIPIATWIVFSVTLGDDLEMMQGAAVTRLVLLFGILFQTEIACLIGACRFPNTKMARFTGILSAALLLLAGLFANYIYHNVHRDFPG